MLDTLFQNEVLMTFLISGVSIIPGFVFTSATNRKYKIRKKDTQIKKISMLYPQ